MTLSIIIVSHNTKDLLAKVLDLLEHRLKENFSDKKEYEIIVVDNASVDGTKEMLQKRKVRAIFLKENVGFSRGNNVGLDVAHGKYVLFLNSDVLLTGKLTISALISFLEKDTKNVGVTIKLMLNENHMDPACHRGFPTPWNAFCYFAHLERLTRGTFAARWFGGYHLTNLLDNTVHEIDCPSAAFFLAKKSAIHAVSGFDPDYFFYAEDIDLCYRLKQKGGRIFFNPTMEALHLKYQSGMAKNSTASHRAKSYFFSSMLIFYEKHYFAKYHPLVNTLVKTGVRILMFINSKKA